MQQNPWDPEGVDTALDPSGKLADGVCVDDIDLRALYKNLVAARCFDLRLSRQSLPMWTSSAGEEAPLVAIGSLLTGLPDWAYVGPRDTTVGLIRGVPVEEILGQAHGMSTSESRGRLQPGLVSSLEHRLAPMTESLGIGVAIAAGQARAHVQLKEDTVTVAIFGEGLSTCGGLQEAIALAIYQDLPLVLVCKSRLWPTAAPAEAGLLGDSTAERFAACGLRTRRIDGADPVGTYLAVQTALSRARKGEGPALIEVVVTPQSIGGQQDPTEAPPPHRDPIERLRRLLDLRREWTQTFQDVIEAEINGRFDHALQTLNLGAQP